MLTNDQIKILMLEDNPDDVELIQRELRKDKIDFIAKVVDCRNEFEKALDEFSPDIIFSDHSLPQFNSLEALKIVKQKNLKIPFILVTGTISEEFAVLCMKAGADDYILKSSLLRLPASIRQTLTKRKVLDEKQIIEQLNKQLKEANLEITQKNYEIISSINYAQNIQQTISPDTDTLYRNFPDSILLYKPKDILSGDFYWFSEEDDKVIVAIVDCTGHGIPGAFMSVLGNILLSEIVTNKKITRPAQILKELNNKTKIYLKQEPSVAPSKCLSIARDGMDAAICAIDKKKNNIEFAGANRPLFFIRDQKLKIYKGDKLSIGGVQPAINSSYCNYTIPFNKGDSIFLFTDGYADQFGGRQDKKMMMKNFIKLLCPIQFFDMMKQKEILNEWLEKWKGSLEQTDDILLLGIRF